MRLRLVAAVKIDRSITEELFISTEFVARHVSSIFNKPRRSTRSAATTYACEHGLV